MTPQHLHTPLVWFSGRADCVPWCVRGRDTYEDAVDIDVFRKFAAWADHATTGV